jgi:hypothetical protein
MKNLQTFDEFLNESSISSIKNGPRVVQELFKKKDYVQITPSTKVEKDDEILGIGNGMFYVVDKVSTKSITIKDFSFGDKEVISREDLEADFIIKKK